MLFVLILIYLLFLLWYYGIPSKIREDEKLSYYAKLKKVFNNEDQPDCHEVEEFTRIMDSDDGKSFLMLNLIKYRNDTKVDKPPKAAMFKYMKMMIPNLLGKAAHPMFMAKVQGPFILGDTTTWDEVMIVRYRSRRDLLNMVIKLREHYNKQIANGEVIVDNKDEAVLQTQVLPIKAKMQLSYVPILVAIVLSLIYIVF